MPRNHDSFDDRVAFITGGAGGIGAALAAELARRGARVMVADVDGERAAAVAEDVRGRGGRAWPVALDVTDPEAFERRIAATVADHGGLDYLFNNAGIGISSEVRDMSLAAWNRIFDVNLKGVVHGVQAAYPRMIEQGSGHIANTACIAGLVPFPTTAAYSATKHAIVAMSSALRAEAADLGVRVSVICPGTVKTGLFDHIEYRRIDKQLILQSLKRRGIRGLVVPPERCARAILRGVERNRAIVTVSLHARLAWWLYRLMPSGFLALTGRAFRALRPYLRSD